MINPSYCPEYISGASSIFVCMACSYHTYETDDFGYKVLSCKHPEFDKKGESNVNNQTTDS